jgi:hypothetical protein
MDEDRDRVERFQCGGKRSPRTVLAREVCLNEGSAELARNCATTIGIDVDQRKLRAFSAKRARNSAPDSGCDSGDERAIFLKEFAQRRKSRMRRVGRVGVMGSMRSTGVSGSR